MFKKLTKPYLIAEIGINHNGSLKLTKELILLAKKYDFDCVKFQKRTPEICVPENEKNRIRSTPWGEMTYFDYKKKIEFGIKEYSEISAFCKKNKIDWFCSSWDIPSQKIMRKFNFKHNKIASAMATNLEFLEFVSKEKKKTYISTGMCTMKDIKKAVSIFKKNKCPFVLLHCVSTYPCPDEELNLNMIETLKSTFKCKVGYSGHESTVSPTIIAWFLGAEVIERHITLDRSMWGTDQASSLSEEGIKMLTSIIKKIPLSLGNGKKILSKNEKSLMKKFRYWT